MASKSDSDKLFYSKLDDGVYLCEKRRSAYFFSFFTEREQMLAQRYLDSAGFHDYAFFGGYEAAERRVLGLFFDGEAGFPVSCITLSFRKCDKLTHRDFLDALMSLGIERETIGDILVEDGRCVIFVKSEIKEYIASQLFKVGNAGVKLSETVPEDLPQGRGFEEKQFTVPSMRLDAVVAALTGLSREKTKSLILAGNVTRNYSECQNISQALADQDILTVRGKGKFVINGVLGETKKHRVRISIIHYR